MANISVDKSTGGFGTLITITGTGFSINKNEDQVKFNGRAADVVSAESGKLMVKVPAKAGTGNITITVKGKTITGPVFNYQLSPFVTTYAGNGNKSYADGSATKASFTYPNAIVIDANGNLFISDLGNGISRIRKISPDSTVSTLATLDHATGDTPAFQTITAMTIGADGNIYAVEFGGVVRKITMDGIVSTFYDGRFTQIYNFDTADGIAFDKSGNMYISAFRSNQIQRVSPAGVASNFVGTGANDSKDGFPGSFFNNAGIEFGPDGILYIADFNGSKIRAADATRHVITVAGNLNNPNDIAFDNDGNLYFTDNGSNSIKMLDKTRKHVIDIAGSFTIDHKDGSGADATFNNPSQLVVSSDGTIYVTDQGNNVIRKIVMI